MKTTSLFTRVIIALSISIVCIDSYAQRIPKVKGNPFKSSSFWGAAGAAGSRALQAQQQEIARRNSEYTRRTYEMQRQNQELQRKYEHMSKFLTSSAHLRTYTPTANLMAFHPSKEQLELYYKRANYSIATGDTIVGVEMLRTIANSGLRDAQYDYGFYCTQGKYVKKDITRGNHFIQEAAKQNHPDALYYLGAAYFYGYEGFQKDSIESIQWLERSAKEGSLQGQEALGNLYFNANDITNAVKYWQMATKNINKADMEETGRQMLGQVYYNLGSIYYNGDLGTSDEGRAINYFKEAANYGNAYSAYILGLIYREKPQNETISCNYIRSSALQGCVDAQVLYGYYCLVGYGTDKDSINAVSWYKEAAANNNVAALCTIPYFYYEAQDNDSTIIWGQRPECCDSADIQYLVGAAYYNKGEYDEAESWWKKSASKQFPDAIWWMYVLNSGIKGDSITGHKYLEQACMQDFPEALCEMGCNYLEGYMVERNVEKGRNLLQIAASKGNGLSYFNLGYSYATKKYNKKVDWTKAAECYRKGAELNCPEAQYSYAYCLKKGKGVKKDKQAATYWLVTAAKNGDEDAIKEIEKMKIDL